MQPEEERQQQITVIQNHLAKQEKKVAFAIFLVSGLALLILLLILIHIDSIL